MLVRNSGSNITRRKLIGHSALAGAVLAMPSILTTARPAGAQSLSASAFAKANIDWKQFKGEEITVGVIPAGYFNNLIDVVDTFEDLSGIKVHFDKIPPGQIRQKAMLDLSSKTGVYATHAADPMYYPLYTANNWVEPLDAYLADPKITDAAWFDYNDIPAGWRGSCSVDGKTYGIPYDGEVTVQVYRKDVYEKAGINPAETLDQFVANAAKVHDPSTRLWAAALRGFAVPVRTCTSIRRSSASSAASGMMPTRSWWSRRNQLSRRSNGMSTFCAAMRRPASRTGTGPISPTPSAKVRLPPTSTPISRRA